MNTLIKDFENVIGDILFKEVTPRYVKYSTITGKQIYLLFDPREYFLFDITYLTNTSFFTIKNNEIILITELNLSELLR